jgi:hypothetical protein
VVLLEEYVAAVDVMSSEVGAGAGGYREKYRGEILQKPPPKMGKTEEVFAGFASVFGFGVMLYFS